MTDLSPSAIEKLVDTLNADNAALRARVEALTEDAERLAKALSIAGTVLPFVSPGARLGAQSIAKHALAAHRALMEGTP